MKSASPWLVGAAVVLPLIGPAAAPAQRWYGGAQGGAIRYRTNSQPSYFDPVLGAHWLVRGRRAALYAAYEQAWFLVDARTLVADPASSNSSVGAGFRDVSFSDMRRLMFGLLAFPTNKAIEPFVGGGFALMQVLNPIVDCSACVTQAEAVEAQRLAEDAASKTFFWFMGGVQINKGKMALFGHYLVTSSAQGFLINGTTHSIEGGIRYSLGTAKEGMTGRN